MGDAFVAVIEKAVEPRRLSLGPFHFGARPARQPFARPGRSCYGFRVNAEDIKRFVRRPRAPVESLKASWWASRTGADGGVTSLEAGHALLEHARRVDPSFPSAEYLALDLKHHVVLKDRLDRASRALARR